MFHYARCSKPGIFGALALRVACCVFSGGLSCESCAPAADLAWRRSRAPDASRTAGVGALSGLRNRKRPRANSSGRSAEARGRHSGAKKPPESCDSGGCVCLSEISTHAKLLAIVLPFWNIVKHRRGFSSLGAAFRSCRDQAADRARCARSAPVLRACR